MNKSIRQQKQGTIEKILGMKKGDLEDWTEDDIN